MAEKLNYSNYKFFIFVLKEQNGGENLGFYPVYVAKKWPEMLTFSNYEAAEKWINDQRTSGNKGLYQIQKIYTP